MSETSPIILRDVSKLFGAIRALNCIDLEVGTGVTGILGPNGSGKSTLLRLLCGQARPDSGEVLVLGQNPTDTPSLMSRLGLCPESDGFYEDLTIFNWVYTLATLSGLPPREARQASDQAIEAVGLGNRKRDRIRDLSQGMRQRAKMAQAIAHDPKVLLLDEPLRGADPIARGDLTKLIRQLGEQNRCVLVSSHILHEIETMTSNVVFLRYGRLRAQGDIFRLRSLLVDRPHTLELVVDEPRKASQILLDISAVHSVRIIDHETLELAALELNATVPQIARILREGNIRLSSLRCPDADLESLYAYLMEGRS